MKDLLRAHTSLSEEIENLLNIQAKNENDASAKYLAMAAWLERNGFETLLTLCTSNLKKKKSQDEPWNCLK